MEIILRIRNTQHIIIKVSPIDIQHGLKITKPNIRHLHVFSNNISYL